MTRFATWLGILGSLVLGLLMLNSTKLLAQANPNQIATLRWYPAITGLSFPVAAGPYGIVFDGANVWVASYTSNLITEFRASDGAVLRTITVALSPYFLTYDGTNIWATTYTTGNSILKIRASDGALLGTYTAGRGPIAIAFDGTSIWVSNANDDTISKLRPSDGAILGTFAVALDPS